MSRKIYKGVRPETTPFQFQQTYSGGGNDLESEAELDAFAERSNAKAKQRQETDAGGSVDVQEIIERAQRDADQIVAGAKQEAAAIEREAYENGIEEGRKTGELMAEQQLQAMLGHYHHSLTTLDRVREIALDQMKLDLLDLILHTTEKIVAAELRANPHAILAMVKDAIQDLKQRRNLTIYLNSEDHRHIQGISESERQSWLGTQVQLETDPQLGRGSFRIETAAGELDAELETRIDRLREEMHKVIEQL